MENNSGIEGVPDTSPKLIIIGAGLVGCLAAKYLVKSGFNVIVYESRKDIRNITIPTGKSINLALSNRGLRALHNAEVDVTALLKMAVSMKGRLIHNENGSHNTLLYDLKYERCIFSVARNDLNKLLLTEAEKRAKFHFECKLTHIDFNKKAVTLLRKTDGVQVTDSFEYLVGCDGAHSIVRQNFVKTPLFNYSQTYIEHGYVELKISPRISNEINMPRNYLHIWPRETFMMIALPNLDESWTVTLFMPFKLFSSIESNEDLIDFFQKYFPDVLPLIGKDDLVKMFFSSKPQPLISIKCSNYNFQSCALIIGDAAHAVVPFYGQGMNAGFEDCYILYKVLAKHGIYGNAFEEFSKVRVVDGNAVSDLSMYNYLEMRNLVRSKLFLLNKKVDNMIYNIVPHLWKPLYICVTFSDIPYSDCMRIHRFQKKILLSISIMICIALLLGIIFFIYN